MNKSILTVVVLLVGIYSSTASAGEWLIGAKIGVVDVDEVTGATTADSALNGVVKLGKEVWDIGVADIAIEAEVSETLSDGEVNGFDSTFDATAVYFSFITAGPVYAIVRAGIADVEYSGQPADQDDSGLSTGLGVGFSTGGFRTELELTQYELNDDTIDVISIGFSF